MEFDELDYFKIEELVVEKRIWELIAHFEALRTKGAMVEQGCVSVAVGDVRSQDVTGVAPKSCLC